MKELLKKVLIIEDDIPVLKALTDKCKLEGFKVVGVRDGKAAFDTCVKEKPDLVLLDLILPGVDGLTVLEKMRMADETKYVPVIVLTNVSNEKVEEACKKFGVSYFMVKTDWKLEEVVKKAKEATSLLQ